MFVAVRLYLVSIYLKDAGMARPYLQGCYLIATISSLLGYLDIPVSKYFQKTLKLCLMFLQCNSK